LTKLKADFLKLGF